MVTDEMVKEARQKLHDLDLKEWLQNDLFKRNWWMIVIFLLLSYILCLVLIDKKRISRILLFGCLITVASFVYDVFASSFVLWSYTSKIFPIIPGIFIFDLTIIPLYYMLVYQYSPSWGRFMLLNALAACFFSLVMIPIMIKLKIYQSDINILLNIPIIFVYACAARFVTLWLVNIEQKHRNAPQT